MVAEMLPCDSEDVGPQQNQITTYLLFLWGDADGLEVEKSLVGELLLRPRSTI
jgi:hypothetical protein